MWKQNKKLIAGALALALATGLFLSACGERVREVHAASSAQEQGYVEIQETAPPSAAQTGDGEASQSPSATSSERPQTAEPEGTGELYEAIPLPDEMRAMWVSFLEWREMDISTEEAMRENFGRVLDNCVAMGLNTVIVSVRPFSDALYRSESYPWSHLIAGTQGQDPGYDPLAVMVEEAHARSLRIEAWVNPFRVAHPTYGPEALSGDNPAVLNPSWLREQGGLWLDPGIPEVRELVVDGVAEIVRNYDVDGIHFDDYFYPEGNTEAFDADTYAAHGGDMELSDWRRGNINEMAHDVYEAVKGENHTVSFGVSPQGNNGNNYNEQYCDINLWMAEPGYADYIMPQLYWGFGYSWDGDDSAAFANKVAEWSGYALHEDARLYAGLGAYRVGDGDGGEGDQAEWRDGHNLADMVAYLREAGGFGGFALFSYADLFPFSADDPYVEIAANEVAALTGMIRE